MDDPMILTPEIIAEICGTVADVDPKAIVGWRQMTSAQRMNFSFALTDITVALGAKRVRSLYPHMSHAEAQRIYLAYQYKYDPEPVVPQTRSSSSSESSADAN